MPGIAAMMLLLAVAGEVVYRVILEDEEITTLTTAINWGCFAAFLVLAILVRFLWWTSWFVCPILTALTYYYFAYIDFERTEVITYFT